MTNEARAQWTRALQRLDTAQREISADPESAANRAFYAAFHAVAALFALEGKTFNSHREISAAVHRDLVKTGRWPTEFGAAYAKLLRPRDIADYGGLQTVDPATATEAVRLARQLVDAVRSISSEPLP